VRFIPPLMVERAHVDEALERLQLALRDALAA
jgi:4-aminobutyrate aminotransferase-like enzyme